MMFRGTITNGVVKPDEGAELPEGLRVEVRPASKGKKKKRLVAASRASDRRSTPKNGGEKRQRGATVSVLKLPPTDYKVVRMSDLTAAERKTVAQLDLSLEGRTRRPRLTKRIRMALAMELCGRWRDRPEWEGMSSVEVVRQMRESSSRRVPNG